MSDISQKAAGIRALIRVIDSIREHYPRMEMGQLAVLLRVLEHPGMRASELMKVTGLSKAALSRAVRLLGSGVYKDDGSGAEKEGLNLLTQIADPSDGRGNLLAPTRLGARLSEDIDRTIGDAYGATSRETMASRHSDG
jgi:DNA-binding MarR family transcriptional regulator